MTLVYETTPTSRTARMQRPATQGRRVAPQNRGGRARHWTAMRQPQPGLLHPE